MQSQYQILLQHQEYFIGRTLHKSESNQIELIRNKVPSWYYLGCIDLSICGAELFLRKTNPGLRGIGDVAKLLSPNDIARELSTDYGKTLLRSGYAPVFSILVFNKNTKAELPERLCTKIGDDRSPIVSIDRSCGMNDRVSKDDILEAAPSLEKLLRDHVQIINAQSEKP